jgi:SOS-response transcriptional repressor LexA
MTRDAAAPLTDRQRAVLSSIIDYRKATGEVPSLMYLARKLSLHHSTVQQHVSELHRKGFLRAAVPGPPLRQLQPLPIPARDEDDGPPATVEERTVTAPTLSEPARVEIRTLPGQSRASSVIVRTPTRTRRFAVLREGGPDGPITGFEVTEEVEG